MLKFKTFLPVFIIIALLTACPIPSIPIQNTPNQQWEDTKTPFQPDQNESNPPTTETISLTQSPLAEMETVTLTQAVPIPTATITLTKPPPTLTFTATSSVPILTLNGNYYCNVGPGANYNRIIIYPSGTQLQIIGWNGGGWYLVIMPVPQSSHTSCWIGGGLPSGNLQDVPIPTPMPAVPAHDPTNWLNVVYLTCPELSTYQWAWGGSSSGEYASLTPIIGIVNATIVYTEYHTTCPGFSPFLKVPIYDLTAGTRIGYISCSEVSTLRWYWNISPGRWISSTALFGSLKATYVPLEMSMNCPSTTPTKVVPVHGASWEIIGFLGCPELETYTWNTGTNSGEWVASTTLFGSNYATIYYEEYTPACPSFTP